MIKPPFRVFVSVPVDSNLTPTAQAVKARIYEMLQQAGFEPQTFGEMGLPITKNLRWTVKEVDEMMRYCQGAVIIGFPRWEIVQSRPYNPFSVATEYSHVEGALALVHQLPTLLMVEDGVSQRGVFDSSNLLVPMPVNVDVNWLSTLAFTRSFDSWRDQVNQRQHVFIGYSSLATAPAQSIILFLRQHNIQVLDWQNFRAGGTILSEIERAASLCLGGIFLFTKDDELKVGDTQIAAPRDNVIFEAGYFAHAKGSQRVLIIREDGAKMPADVGGNIYLSLKDRNDTSTIETALLKFINDRL